MYSPLSQRDPKWKKIKLGFSDYTIEQKGCTLTCLTCLINHVENAVYTPAQVNEWLKYLGNYNKVSNPKGAFQDALIVWQNVPRAFPSLKFIKRVRNYNNIEVSLYVYVYGLPVMVEVYGGKIGAPIHWILFIGKRQAMDPWTGKFISTSYYDPCTGYSLFEKK